MGRQNAEAQGAFALTAPPKTEGISCLAAAPRLEYNDCDRGNCLRLPGCSPQRPSTAAHCLSQQLIGVGHRCGLELKGETEIALRSVAKVLDLLCFPFRLFDFEFRVRLLCRNCGSEWETEHTFSWKRGLS
ncbi:hypothetical protein AVEN_232427-1 [Araneus ventricosus]|uniref:Uncharacterized protein n=1 Tax=Araneus ventricosus TaxID=182803 RepID=A0A4Y2SQD6_ARAVE|nr:hypothetical protein AVEN_232427-1 [Araneus ventricosus]